MGYVHMSRHIPVDPDTLYEYVTDTERLPSWLLLVEEVHDASLRMDHVGAELHATFKLGPRHLAIDWTVGKADAGSQLQLEGTSEEGGEAELVAMFGLWDGETEFSFDLEYELPGGFVTSMADRIWIERAIALDLKRSLKALAQDVRDHT